MLLHIFAACPEPETHNKLLAHHFKQRLYLLTLSSPPTIKVKVPSTAPTTPPETGASKVNGNFFEIFAIISVLLYLL